jgi:hypothetical protein
MTFGLAAVAPGRVLATTPRGGSLAFVVYRNGVAVGRHLMTFSGPADSPRVTTEVEMTIKLGPVPVFRYRHHAEERWLSGQFADLDTRTDANGRKRRVSARRTEAGVMIDTGGAKVAAPANAAPLTHWNNQVLGGPLFNPQEGKLLRINARLGGVETIKAAGGATIRATRWSLRGDAEIENWYDASGAWAALRGKLPDGSMMEYRRA